MRARRRLAALCAALALGCAVDAGWIHAKAVLAQLLLQRAWSATQQDGQPHRPWPWADSTPVAALTMPRLGVEQIVLSGDSGRVLAFAPGWAPASDAPGGVGTVVISGHRDTHFAWLRDLRIGDRVRLHSLHGSREFRIERQQVVDSGQASVPLAADDQRLLLVTCWPFDAIEAGGPLRYLVTARAVPPGQRRRHPEKYPADSELLAQHLR